MSPFSSLLFVAGMDTDDPTALNQAVVLTISNQAPVTVAED